MQFWIDELSSRRTENVLRRIADATDENAGQVAQMTMLVEQGAEQTTEMVGLNRTMVTLTRRVFWLTAASVVLAVTAVIVALIALASSGDESGDESGWPDPLRLIHRL